MSRVRVVNASTKNENGDSATRHSCQTSEKVKMDESKCGTRWSSKVRLGEELCEQELSG
jgi:hypothetical protein